MQRGKRFELYIIYSFLAFATLACECNEQNEKNLAGETIENPTRIHTYSDILKEENSDSLNTEIIRSLINEIDFDSSLKKIEAVDSLNQSIWYFYRNNSLVKIMLGTLPFHEDNLYGFNGNTTYIYYFLSDTLLNYQYHCSTTAHTSRCNPVSSHSILYFYKDEIINQFHANSIHHPYESCGCGDYSQIALLGHEEEFIQDLYSKINYLKSIVPSHD